MAESTIKNSLHFIRKNYTATKNIAASSTGYVTATELGYSIPTGYIPVGIASFSSTDVAYPFAVSAFASGGQGAIWIKNTATSARDISVNVCVLYAKSDYVQIS